jgi:integrase
MLARGLVPATIKARCAVVSRFQAFTGEFPWSWRPVDIEDFLADLRSRDKPISLTTLRAYSNGVAMFCAYLTHQGYGWGEFCERTIGDVPSQICFEWNTPRHTTDDAVPPTRRSFSKAELQHLFDHVDDVVDREFANGSKRWLPALRDSIAFKVCYAYGLRRRELTMLDLDDFGPNPHVADFARFGAVTVRWGKGTAATTPPRIAIAVHNAARAKAASWRVSSANPTQRRECRSSTAARWNFPSAVGISVRSPHQRTSGRGGGAKSRFNASGAFRADLSALVSPRRLRFGRATRCCSAINAATVLTLTRQPRSRRSSVIRGEP